MNYRNVALLLDSAPPTWTSQEDRHFRLCLRTSRPDYQLRTGGPALLSGTVGTREGVLHNGGTRDAEGTLGMYALL